MCVCMCGTFNNVRYGHFLLIPLIRFHSPSSHHTLPSQIRSEVHMTVIMKTAVFCDVTSCNLVYLPVSVRNVSKHLPDYTVSKKICLHTRYLSNNAVFWDVAPCISCLNRRFGGKYRLHLQGRKIRERGTSVSRWL
jgi:hypothetical protein